LEDISSSNLIKSIVFCENRECQLFCHVVNESSYCEICSICGTLLRTFCKYCPLVRCDGETRQRSGAVFFENYMIAVKHLTKQHLYNNEGAKMTSTTFATANKKYWRHLSGCNDAKSTPLFIQVCTLIDGYRVLENELERTAKPDQMGIYQYKISIIRSRMNQLSELRSEMLTEKMIKQIFLSCIAFEGLNELATKHFTSITEQDKNMISYINQCLHDDITIKTNWFKAPIKLDSIYPDHAKYDAPAHVSIHASNLSQILHPDQIRVLLKGQNFEKEVRIVGIQKNSIRCFFPAMPQPIGAVKVFIISKSLLCVDNTHTPIFHYLKSENKYVSVRHVERDIGYNSLNQSLAFQCVWDGDLNFLKELISQDPRKYLTNIDDLGRTPLHIACALNQLEIVRYLFALYGCYFQHLKLDNYAYTIFSMRDVNGCNIFIIAKLYDSQETLSFLSQFISESRVMKSSNFEESINNLVYNYLPESTEAGLENSPEMKNTEKGHPQMHHREVMHRNSAKV
jgi:hypothetical protein